MRWIGFLCHVLSPWCTASPQAQKQQDQLTIGWNILKLWVKVNFSSLQVDFLRYFVIARESWLTHFDKMQHLFKNPSILPCYLGFVFSPKFWHICTFHFT
jgi:hypothetical protein